MDSNRSILRGPICKLTPFRIYKRFEEAVKSNAAKEALIFEDDGVVRRHTFEELNNLANHLAKIIRTSVDSHTSHSSDEKHRIIAVHMSASDYLIITLLAIWKAGASYLPLDPNYPKHRIEYIIRDAKPAMIIYEKDDNDFTSSSKLNISNVISSYTSSKQLDEKFSKEPEDDLAIVLYTSGTTGNPKGVCISHTTLSNRLEWQFKNFPFSETEKVCVCKTVITFVDSIFEIWAPLLKGRAVLVLPHTTIKNPEKLVEALEKYKIERIILVPTLLETITLYKRITGKTNLLQNLRLWISSGEVLTENHVKQFYETFSCKETKLCNFYGSTEITDVTYYVFTNADDFYKYNCFPLGGAVDNTIIYVLDSNLQKCEESVLGEIYISGLNLPIEYISCQNEAKLIDNPFETDPMFSKLYKIGDYGFIQDGFLFYKGRADAVVKLRGYRVDLLEVDKVVNSTEGVKKGVVLFHQNEILAFIRKHDLATKQAINDNLTARLVHYMVPKIVLVNSIPLLVNGKTDRQLLLKNFVEERPSVKDIDTANVPEHQLERAKILFQIISELSSGQINSKISIRSNFYEIGGNSLNSIWTISKLMERGYRVSIHDFIKSANLGEILDKMTKDSYHALTPSFQEYENYVIETMQHDHKSVAFEILITSFLNKSNIEVLIDGITKEHYYEYLGNLWPTMLASGSSFLVKSKEGSTIAASFNCDMHANVDFTINSPLEIMDTFFSYLEKIAKSKIQKNYTKVCYAFMLGTVESLTPQENVLVVHFMEQKIIKLAQAKGYEGILAFNQSPLTEDIGRMYGYVSLLDYQVNRYVTKDNKKPFENAPDYQKVVAHFKKL